MAASCDYVERVQSAMTRRSLVKARCLKADVRCSGSHFKPTVLAFYVDFGSN